MKRYILSIIAVAVVFLTSFGSAYALSTYQTVQGGTGTSSPSGILYGDNGTTSHLNTVSIGSGLSFSGGTLSASGGSGGTATTSFAATWPITLTTSTSAITYGFNGLSTTSPWTVGNVAEVAGNGTLTGVGTSTPSIGSVLTYSGTLGNLLGGTSGTFGIANSAVTNAMLANSTISGVALGANLNSLTHDTTFNGTSYNGSAAVSDWGLNLSHANTWTALQQFNANASSTQLTVTGNTYLASAGGNVGIASTSPAYRFSIGTGSSATYTTSSGESVGYDATNAWNGRVNPTKSFALQTGTTTTWTASTTGSGYSPFLTMPFAGTVHDVRCLTDQSFIGVNVQVNGSNATPSYFVASTTVGTIPFTAGNTFSAGQEILANFGTTTTASTQSVSCTFDITETP